MADQGLAGKMIWSLDYDVKGERSLLSAMYDTMEQKPSKSIKNIMPTIGAIRWDAWYKPLSEKNSEGYNGPAMAMTRSMGPEKYHYRLPFFASVSSVDKISINGYTQEVVDREIAYARAGGLDYWAFLLYDENSGMSQGLKFYLSSIKKKDMHFCVISYPSLFGNSTRLQHEMQRVIKLISEPTYQKVMGNRPLVYLLMDPNSDGYAKALLTEPDARKWCDNFREEIKKAGKGDPYIVICDYDPVQGNKFKDILGADAISAYAWAYSPGGITPYKAQVESSNGYWNSMLATGANIIPNVTSGWDRRPRIEQPVPWETYQKPGVGLDDYVAMPTPQELADNIHEAMQFCRDNQPKCPAQTVLIYAWNEHDEGGYLCPTLKVDGSADTSRLDAIALMLRNWKSNIK